MSRVVPFEEDAFTKSQLPKHELPISAISYPDSEHMHVQTKRPDDLSHNGSKTKHPLYLKTLFLRQCTATGLRDIGRNILCHHKNGILEVCGHGKNANVTFLGRERRCAA
mmetsp:Transcript_28572/g.47381  ORF Transcript_28572/g.47381 Transcript_28572/m.47381 type:complete len:110 (+) Transcript_28572:44-373(+)